MVTITEFQKIGVGVMGFGLFFLLFGVLLYFDSVLLAFGNILFLTGLVFIIGLSRTAQFFFQRQKFRGSFFFLGGVALVLCRWPIIGMLVESYGFVLLFRSFFPMALGLVLSFVNIPYLSAGLLKALRDLASKSYSAKSSGNDEADEADDLVGAEFSMGRWWMPKVVPRKTKKHQDLSSYNLNSFGLRYGK
ncbi:vesicle transport protein GOT1A-like [Diretmus argenteus]